MTTATTSRKTLKAPKAPVWLTEAEAAIWKAGWAIGYQTSVPAYLPDPHIGYTAEEAKVWVEGRDRGFWDRFFSTLGTLSN